MRESLVVLQDTDASVILEAIKDTKYSFDSWIANKVDAAIKGQRTANLARDLRGHAQACKLTVGANAYASVEDFIAAMHIEAKVTEFGGLGAFVKLANACKGDYIPESKIHRAVVVVPAPEQEEV